MMRPTTSFMGVAAVTAVMLGGVAPGAVAQQSQRGAAASATRSAPAAANPQNVQPAAPATAAAAIRAVAQAPDPSSAIEAYAQGYAVAPKDMALKEAYVQRMVSFDLPAMADAQARELLVQNPRNALALAVEATNSARRGMIGESMTDMVQAASIDPTNLFVLRTAGQLIAYYDTIADQSQLSAKLRQAIDQTHRALDPQPAFVKAYLAARQAYLRGEAQLEQQPGTGTPGAPGAPTTPRTPGAGQGQGQQGNGPQDQAPFSGYAPQNNVYNYNYYGGYPAYYGYGAWWWPGGTTVIIGFGTHHHHHHYHPWFHRGPSLPHWLLRHHHYHYHYRRPVPRTILPLRRPWQGNRDWYRTRGYQGVNLGGYRHGRPGQVRPHHIIPPNGLGGSHHGQGHGPRGVMPGTPGASGRYTLPARPGTPHHIIPPNGLGGFHHGDRGNHHQSPHQSPRAAPMPGPGGGGHNVKQAPQGGGGAPSGAAGGDHHGR